MALREMAAAQLAEIDLLSSMFPSLEELEITDQLALAELREQAEEGSTPTPPLSSRPQFLIKQKMDVGGVEVVDVAMSCTFPPEYPNVLPEIAVRCPAVSRAQQTLLHRDMNVYLTENCRGEVCVLSAVDWLRDNVCLYVEQSASAPPAAPAASTQPRETFTRLWIYSHHIYNKSKRKNILEWSRELGLSGFSMPGKPGVVCVEGLHSACEEFWSRVKVLTWKKIMIRHREDVELDSQGVEGRAGEGRAGEGRTGEGVTSLCRFSGFEEAVFDPHGTRGNHMDLGQLYHFLNEKGCGEIFQLYFGVEGR